MLWKADCTQPETAAMTSAGPKPTVSIATNSAANDVDIVAHPRASGTWILSADSAAASARRPAKASGAYRRDGNAVTSRARPVAITLPT